LLLDTCLTAWLGSLRAVDELSTQAEGMAAHEQSQQLYNAPK